MISTPKSSEVNDFINKLSGDNREEQINQERCVKPPTGCGKAVLGFRDRISQKEYTISGLCQGCQDRIFGKPMAHLDVDLPLRFWDDRKIDKGNIDESNSIYFTG